MRPLSVGNKKIKRHPLSLLRDDTLPMRMLDSTQNIFDIIMPWVAEKDEEEKKRKKELAPKKKKDSFMQGNLSSYFEGKKGAKKADQAKDRS